MHITRLQAKNWKNFTEIDLPLRDRMFIVGPNASGKSNFLDIFSFLKELTNQNGLPSAIDSRGGIANLRSHAARDPANIEILVELKDKADTWKYELKFDGFQFVKGAPKTPVVLRETVQKNNITLESRDFNPKAKGKSIDIVQFQQTIIGNVHANTAFRPIWQFFQDICYQNIIPELIRKPAGYTPAVGKSDFGTALISEMVQASPRILASRLQKITDALKNALPQLVELNFDESKKNEFHLKAKYANWRGSGIYQKEENFSDGTLRLIGLLWALLKKDFSLLLLEEPEISLHPAVAAKLAAIFWQIQKGSDRQIFMSTHSTDLLSDESIELEEIIVLTPEKETTRAIIATCDFDIQNMLKAGLPIQEVIRKKTQPQNINQLTLNV